MKISLAICFFLFAAFANLQIGNSIDPARSDELPLSQNPAVKKQQVVVKKKKVHSDPSDPKIAAEHHFTLADIDHNELLDRDEFKSLYLHLTSRLGGVVMSSESEHGKYAGISQTGLSVAESAMNFWGAFFNSVAMIIVTELGDKTFFIAAILAMRNPRGIIFAGAISALVIMTVLSTVIGFALPQLLPKAYTHVLAAGLFAYFGYKLLSEAYGMYKEGKGGANDTNEELTEVEEELKSNTALPSTKDDVQGKLQAANFMILSQAFTMTFFAEWGDRSQIATIALAAHKDPYGVTLGGCIGHSLCTGIAVIGGRYLAGKIPERTVLLAGGVLFVLFALHAMFFG